MIGCRAYLSTRQHSKKAPGEYPLRANPLILAFLLPVPLAPMSVNLLQKSGPSHSGLGITSDV